MNDRYAKGYLVKQEICFSDGNGFVFGEKSDEAFPLAVWNFTGLDDRREYTNGRYFIGKDADLAALDFGERVAAYKTDNPETKEKYNYLAAAEMSGEQNYNQIDGVLNNTAQPKADLTDGVTHDELIELAPETLAKSEKPSILEQLRDFKPEVSEPSGSSNKSANIER